MAAPDRRRARWPPSADEPLDWRYKGSRVVVGPDAGRDRARETPDLFDAGAVGPVCVLRARALTHNLATMAAWCRERGVELAPHGKTHMAPQLFARQLDAGRLRITVGDHQPGPRLSRVRRAAT